MGQKDAPITNGLIIDLVCSQIHKSKSLLRWHDSCLETHQTAQSFQSTSVVISVKTTKVTTQVVRNGSIIWFFFALKVDYIMTDLLYTNLQNLLQGTIHSERSAPIPVRTLALSEWICAPHYLFKPGSCVTNQLSIYVSMCVTRSSNEQHSYRRNSFEQLETPEP